MMLRVPFSMVLQIPVETSHEGGKLWHEPLAHDVNLIFGLQKDPILESTFGCFQ